MSLIKLEGISKIFGFGDASSLALDSISLTIEKGEFVAVMGPSGSGKSTLMNIIGLLDKPSQGSYMLDNKYVARLKPNQAAKIRRDTIGFVFQSYNLLNRLNIISNVSLPLVYKGVSSSRRLKLASDILERVGISEKEYFYPNQLSGGQLQSAAIARALINNPKLIIADEPTGNLDSISSILIMELLTEIHRAGNTIIFVTHNPELTRYASRVVYMKDGSIVQDEITPYGQIAKTAKQLLKPSLIRTEEDSLAGVSVLMKTIDKIDSRKNKKDKPKKNRRSKK